MKERNFGLDLMRAAAIIFVLINHIINYFITFHKSTVFGDMIGILGVELFFVLSGFLIGRILLTDFAADMQLSHIKQFYLRRWFRTLPLYYFLLIIFIIVGFVVVKQPDFHPLHFLFLQNFVPNSLAFFSVSWSLAIEEWFYLLTPLLLFFAYKKKLLSRQSIHVLWILIVGIMLARLLYVFFVHPTFEDIHKNVFFRFDSLLIGVMLAGLKLYEHPLYKEFQKPSRLLIAVVFILVLAISFKIYYDKELLDTSIFARAFAFPVLSFFIAMLIPFLENSRFINQKITNNKVFKSFITWMSILSYSIYLIHLFIFDGVKAFFHEKPHTPGSLMAIIGLSIAFVLSYILYRFIEKPFMQMRERFR